MAEMIGERGEPCGVPSGTLNGARVVESSCNVTGEGHKTLSVFMRRLSRVEVEGIGSSRHLRSRMTHRS